MVVHLTCSSTEGSWEVHEPIMRAKTMIYRKFETKRTYFPSEKEAVDISTAYNLWRKLGKFNDIWQIKTTGTEENVSPNQRAFRRAEKGQLFKDVRRRESCGEPRSPSFWREMAHGRRRRHFIRRFLSSIFPQRQI